MWYSMKRCRIAHNHFYDDNFLFFLLFSISLSRCVCCYFMHYFLRLLYDHILSSFFPVFMRTRRVGIFTVANGSLFHILFLFKQHFLSPSLNDLLFAHKYVAVSFAPQQEHITNLNFDASEVQTNKIRTNAKGKHEWKSLTNEFGNFGLFGFSVQVIHRGNIHKWNRIFDFSVVHCFCKALRAQTAFVLLSSFSLLEENIEVKTSAGNKKCNFFIFVCTAA